VEKRGLDHRRVKVLVKTVSGEIIGIGGNHTFPASSSHVVRSADWRIGPQAIRGKKASFPDQPVSNGSGNLSSNGGGCAKCTFEPGNNKKIGYFLTETKYGQVIESLGGHACPRPDDFDGMK